MPIKNYPLIYINLHLFILLHFVDTDCVWKLNLLAFAAWSLPVTIMPARPRSRQRTEAKIQKDRLGLLGGALSSSFARHKLKSRPVRETPDSSTCCCCTKSHRHARMTCFIFCLPEWSFTVNASQRCFTVSSFLSVLWIVEQRTMEL
jgi:hypothetical protein